MSLQFHRPEHALRYAQDAERVGHEKDALKALKSFITQKSFTREWTPAHEKLILKYFDLCVEQKTAGDAKEGIYRYRMLTQTNHPHTLQQVVFHLIEQALTKARQARDEVKDSSALDRVEDLEEEESPENLLMSTMSTETDKDRLERELLVPWVRYAWDTFRNVLDQLRNVIKLEETYHIVAKRTFEFCKEFNRTAEFRKLCSQMRLHLRSWRTYQEMHGESWSQETMERHISTKFVQLDHCADMEMWGEGYRTVEDIHTMMQMTGLKPGPTYMASYYQSLARIFWKSEDYLFHAYALFKHYTLAATHLKSMKSEDRSQLAAAAVLSSLCIPLFQTNTSDDETYFKIDLERDKKYRLAKLLNFSATPSRSALMEDLRSRGVTKHVPQQMQSLWENLEEKFHPLSMIEKVKPTLEWASSNQNLSEYVPHVERLLVQRVLEQLTRVYTVVRLPVFENLVAPLSLSNHEIEQVIVRAVRSRLLQVRIDHQQGCLRLGEVNMESGALRKQLAQLSQGLHTATDCLSAKQQSQKVQLPSSLVSRRDATFREAKETLPKAQEEALKRKDEIERRKEGAEREKEIKAREEEVRRLQLEQEKQKQENARIEEEQKRREEEKMQQIQEEEQLREKERLLRAAGKEVSKFSREDIKAVDKVKLQEELEEKQRKKLEEEQKRREEKSRKLDYLVRAMRETEQEKLQQWTRKKLDDDEVYVEQQQQAIYKREKEKHEKSLDIKKRLSRVLPYRRDFETIVMARRRKDYEREREQELYTRKKKWAADKVKRANQRKKEDEEEKRRAEVEKLRLQEAQQNAEREEEEERRREAEILEKEEANRRDRERRLAEQEQAKQPRAATGWRAAIPAQPPVAPSEGTTDVKRENSKFPATARKVEKDVENFPSWR